MKECDSAAQGWDAGDGTCPKCDEWGTKIIKDYPEKCPECNRDQAWSIDSCKRFKVVISGEIHKFCVLGFKCCNGKCGRVSFGRVHRMDMKCPKCKHEWSFAAYPRTPRTSHCKKRYSDPRKIQFDR